MSMPQVCPGFLWETGFTWLSSGRFQRSRHELTQKRTAWRSSRSVRSATSTSSSPSQSFHASCWWGMGWRNSGGPIESSVCKICAAVLSSPAHRCTSLTNFPSLWPSSPTSSLSPWPMAWMQSWCMDALTLWLTVPPQVVAVVEAKLTAWSAQSPSGLHRVLQRARRCPLKETVRYHSERADWWFLHRASVKSVVAPRGHEAREKYGGLPAMDIAVNFPWPFGNWLGWLVSVISFRVLVPSCGCSFTCTLLQQLTVIK